MKKKFYISEGVGVLRQQFDSGSFEFLTFLLLGFITESVQISFLYFSVLSRQSNMQKLEGETM